MSVMKKDTEVKLFMQYRRKGLTQAQAAAKADMSERTAHKYERAGKLPSELKRPRTWRTRPNPFEEDWPWVVEHLERDPALQGTTLFALLCQRHPDRYRPTQVRTLQRQIAAWRALQGPEREVIFEQVHTPGERAQSDFTHMEDLGVTIAGEPFPHLMYHFVLTYSNMEAVRLCFSESFEALAEGIEQALWQLGGVPKQHRTDHLTAAVHQLPKEQREEWTARYQALMAHYGMEATTHNVGVAHENGDVEQAHHRFKEALDQALRVRGSRDFGDRAGYERFVAELVKQRNQTRKPRFKEDLAALAPLPQAPLSPCREMRVRVSRFSTITVLGNTYSVPSRLIGTRISVRVRAEHIEGYVGTQLAYRYREELFPTTIFRKTYDRLQSLLPRRADREYVRLFHLAAGHSESEVETALSLLLEAKSPPTVEAVRDVLGLGNAGTPPEVERPALDLSPYDRLVPSARRNHASLSG